MNPLWRAAALGCLLAACGGRSQRQQLPSPIPEGGAGASDASAGGAPAFGAPLACEALGASSVNAQGYEILVSLDENDRFAPIAARDSTLIAQQLEAFVHITADGRVTRVASDAEFSALVDGRRLLFSPRGNALLATGTRNTVFDAELSRVGEWTTDPGRSVLSAGFSASGRLLVISEGIQGLDKSSVQSLRVRRLTGELVADLDPSDRSPLVPASDDQVVHVVNRTGLRARRFDGSELWSVDLEGPELINVVRSSDDGRELMVVSTGSRVVHVRDGVALAAVTLPAAPWDQVIARNGVYSGVSLSNPGRLAIFVDGELSHVASLGLKYVNTLAVNDNGQFLMGGRTEGGLAAVLIIDSTARLLLSCTGGLDQGAFSPWVFYTGDQRQAVTLWRDRLRVFGVSD